MEAYNQAFYESQAMNKLGFRAYQNLSGKKQVAMTKPDEYLKAKRDFILGVGRDNAKVATAGHSEILYGEHKEKDIPGVAKEASELYAKTLLELYKAGADEETAEKYARQVGQALADSKMAIINLQFPDYYGEDAEKSLLKASVTGSDPEKMLAAKALPEGAKKLLLES
jgi:hypothetical protein